MSQAHSILEQTSAADLDAYLARCKRYRPALDTESVRDSVMTSLRAHNKGEARGKLELSIEARWYESLRAGNPDYGVYDTEYYVGDVWTCWLTYSRKYLLALRSQKALERGSIVDLLTPHVACVVDLGCGVGNTTAALKEFFPTAAVFGTNLEATLQWKVAEEIGSEREFALLPRIDRRADLVFASEYFEHIERPVEHLAEVLEVGKPYAILYANAFSARSVGHFNTYKHRRSVVPGRAIGRLFSRELRVHGYQAEPTRLWNNRPALWMRRGW
jgi:SAM-dependent methyltransferase